MSQPDAQNCFSIVYVYKTLYTPLRAPPAPPTPISPSGTRAGATPREMPDARAASPVAARNAQRAGPGRAGAGGPGGAGAGGGCGGTEGQKGAGIEAGWSIISWIT